MKIIKYLCLLFAAQLSVTSCTNDPMADDDTVYLAMTYYIYDAYTENSISDACEIYDMYVYQSEPYMSTFNASDESDCDYYSMENFVDMSTDDEYYFTYTQVQDIKDGEIKRRRDFEVRGSKDRTFYPVLEELNVDSSVIDSDAEIGMYGVDFDWMYVQNPITLKIWDGETGELLDETDAVEVIEINRAFSL